MKADMFNGSGSKAGEVSLPAQFKEEVRTDLIKRAVVTIQANKRQPYGADVRAGKEQSTKISRRRHNYKGAYGRGVSRVPRKTILRRGTQFIWVGARAPGTVGGARAHPPKASKIWNLKINKKERLKALRSAIAATRDKDLVNGHGYMFKEVPLVLTKEVEKVDKTSKLKTLLVKIGMKEDLERVLNVKIRAGRGKSRGRAKKVPVGPLVVVSGECGLVNATRNLQGFEVCCVESLNAELLAPGAVPGRLVIWTESALERLDKEKLFLKDKPKVKKEVKEDKK
tara:strand:+ start:425 stop:1273 length:849 start_codon:yes stop_codon:yes gene_type:complete